MVTEKAVEGVFIKNFEAMTEIGLILVLSSKYQSKRTILTLMDKQTFLTNDQTIFLLYMLLQGIPLFYGQLLACFSAYCRRIEASNSS